MRWMGEYQQPREWGGYEKGYHSTRDHTRGGGPDDRGLKSGQGPSMRGMAPGGGGGSSPPGGGGPPDDKRDDEPDKEEDEERILMKRLNQ